MGLEEERLTGSKDAELAAAAGLPEVHLRYLWACGQEAVPVIVGHAHVCPHGRYCAPRHAGSSGSGYIGGVRPCRELPPTGFPTMLTGVYHRPPPSVTWADCDGWVSADTGELLNGLFQRA
jgi:hypothetical protein